MCVRVPSDLVEDPPVAQVAPAQDPARSPQVVGAEQARADNQQKRPENSCNLQCFLSPPLGVPYSKYCRFGDFLLLSFDIFTTSSTA